MKKGKRYIKHPLLNWSLNPEFNGHNELGFRTAFLGDSKAVYCMGGSSTYCWGIENTQSFPYLIGKITGHTTINGGVPGYTFLQSFMRFMMWRKMFNVKWVVVYDGKNDIIPLSVGLSNPDYTPVMKRFSPTFFNNDVYSAVYGKRNLRDMNKNLTSEMRACLFSHYDNLYHVCKGEGIKCLFIPQVTKTQFFHKYLSDLSKYLSKYDMLNIDDSLFYDNTHFSVDGAKKLAEMICERL